MKKSIKIKIQILILISLMLVSTGFRCKCVTPAQKELLQPIELTWWGVFEDQADLNEIINDYKIIHPNISITYRKLREEEFETELLEALAEDRGPDIFSIHNTWVEKYISKIEPLPDKTTMAYEITQKSLGVKQETIIEVRDNVSITPTQLKNTFIDVIASDVVKNNKIYGLPLSMDTLVLFYNRDLLNNAGIPLPPTSWQAVQESVKQLTFQDQSGNLIQSGVALGRGKNIENSPDILSLLMMQNGAEMTVGKAVAFGAIPPDFPDKNYNPGPEAIRFYTDFASPTKEVYTWNEKFPNSIDAFAAGQVAMMFGYNHHIPYLEAKRQGKLNYGIAKIPQIEGRPEINFANYWVNTVSKKSKNQNAAWDFIQFATKKTEAKKYLEKTSRPTALRSLIEEQLANDALNIFADQLLTATSWYKGNNSKAAKEALIEMIESINEGSDVKEAIEISSLKIQQTIQ